MTGSGFVLSKRRAKMKSLNQLPGTIPVHSPHQLRSNYPQKNVHKTKTSTDSLSYIYSCLATVSAKSAAAGTMFLLQLTHGLRFQDLKNIKNSHVTVIGLINLVSSKKSKQRIIYFPDLLQHCSFNPVDSDEPVFLMSYRQYYSILRRSGAMKKTRDNAKNWSVAHLCRKFTFEELHQSLGVSSAVIKQFSGHLTMNGLNYYTGRKSLHNAMASDTPTT